MWIIIEILVALFWNVCSLCRINPALEAIDVTETEPLVTFPDDTTPTEEREICLHNPQSVANANDLNNAKSYLNSMDTVKFEEKRMTSASQTKVISDGYSSERVSKYDYLIKLKRKGRRVLLFKIVCHLILDCFS